MLKLGHFPRDHAEMVIGVVAEGKWSGVWGGGGGARLDGHGVSIFLSLNLPCTNLIELNYLKLSEISKSVMYRLD